MANIALFLIPGDHLKKFDPKIDAEKHISMDKWDGITSIMMIFRASPPVPGMQRMTRHSPQAPRLSNHVDAWLALMSFCLHQHEESTCFASPQDFTSDLSRSWVTLGRTTAAPADWRGNSDSWKRAITLSPAILKSNMMGLEWDTWFFFFVEGSLEVKLPRAEAERRVEEKE